MAGKGEEKPLGSHLLVGDAEVMPSLPERSLPLEAQTHTQGTPTHCCCDVGDVLGSKSHKVGGLGCASLCCAPLQNEAGLGITGQQQDKVPKPIEGVGEAIQGGDVRVPEGTSWGPKEMEQFCGEEEEKMLLSFQGGEQPQSCGGSAVPRGILQSVGVVHSRGRAWGLTGGGWHISLTANPRSLLSKPGTEQGLPHSPAAPVERFQLPVCGGR